jgi:hypothetical protein
LPESEISVLPKVSGTGCLRRLRLLHTAEHPTRASDVCTPALTGRPTAAGRAVAGPGRRRGGDRDIEASSLAYQAVYSVVYM